MPIDYSRYPKDWKERVARVRKRDGNRCTRCGVRGNVFPKKGERRVVLTTAHLDHDEENWEVSDDRLATMCASCHLAYDRHDNLYRKRYGQNYKRTIPTLNFPS
jgi:heterodisulfide reductase subunit B